MEDAWHGQGPADKLIEGYQKPEDLIGESGLLKQLAKALVGAMNAELTHHLEYEKNDPQGRGSGNSRNGKSRKKLKGDFGEIDIEDLAIAKASSNPRSSSMVPWLERERFAQRRATC